MDKIQKYQNLINDYDPSNHNKTVTFHFEGLCNDAAIVDERFVFRFPKESWAVPLLQQEIAILSHLNANKLDLAYQCLATKDDFGVFSFISGKECTNHLLTRCSLQQREQIAKSIGCFLMQLHCMDTSNIPYSGATRSKDEWIKLYQEVQAQKQLLTSCAIAFVEEAFQPLLNDELDFDYNPALIHGDLAPYHLLVKHDLSGLAGVIDFGEAGLGDPATDLACLLYNYGEAFFHEVITWYPTSTELLQRVKFYANVIEIQWFVMAVKTKNPLWFGAHLGSKRGF